MQLSLNQIGEIVIIAIIITIIANIATVIYSNWPL